MNTQVIHVHRAAPGKPAWGAACNGCGVCCLAEPCPLGMLVSRRRRGACAAVEWDGQRYRCGLLAAATGWRRRLVARWIGAGRGCDSSAELSYRGADAAAAAGATHTVTATASRFIAPVS